MEDCLAAKIRGIRKSRGCALDLKYLSLLVPALVLFVSV